MPKHFKYFTQVGHLDDLQVAKFIDSAVTTLEDFRPVTYLLEKLGNTAMPLRILDFGCGVGRNTIGMIDLSKKWEVTGYDNHEMIERGKRFYGNRLQNKRVELFDDWNKLLSAKRNGQQKPFDVIFCCLVLQHIDRQQLKEYFSDFVTLTDKLFVCGRRALDEEWNNLEFINVWECIQEYFEPIELENGLATGTNPHDHHYGIFKPRK